MVVLYNSSDIVSWGNWVLRNRKKIMNERANQGIPDGKEGIGYGHIMNWHEEIGKTPGPQFDVTLPHPKSLIQKLLTVKSTPGISQPPWLSNVELADWDNIMDPLILDKTKTKLIRVIQELGYGEPSGVMGDCDRVLLDCFEAGVLLAKLVYLGVNPDEEE